MRLPANTKLSNSAFQRGFTLLEMMLVITIIGILIGVSVMSFGAVEQRRYRDEAGRIKLALNQAMDVSLMRQKTLAWFYDEETHRYEFRFWSPEGTWEPLSEPEILKPYRLADHYSLKITNSEDLLGEEKEKPLLVFLASGEYTPFRLVFEDNKHLPVQLAGDGIGMISTAQ